MAFSELIALYLFLGGTSAGSFAVLSVIDLRIAYSHARCGRFSRVPSSYFACRSRSVTHRRIGRAVYGASFVMMIAGLLCLLADLGKPEAFYLIFLYPTSSFMSIGAFALTFMTICLAVALAEAVLVLGPAWERLALVAKAVGIVFSLVVMLYTGFLLETVLAVQLWTSLWLPVLFLLSALSCGCAVVLLGVCVSGGCEGLRAWLRRLTIVDALIVALEAVVTVAFVVSVAATGGRSALDVLLFGNLTWLFWVGFVACGMVVPFALELDALLVRRSHRPSVVAATAALVLVGGLCLRFALVVAGVHPIS